MGFFGAVMNKLGEMVGEQVFPYYQNTALNMKAQDLRREVENGENKLPYRAVYLLALVRKDKYAACKIYEQNKTQFENAFNQLYSYRRFMPVIDEFRRKVSQSLCRQQLDCSGHYGIKLTHWCKTLRMLVLHQ